VTDEIMRKLQKAYPEKNIPQPINVYVPRWDLDPLFLGAFSFKPVSKNDKDNKMFLKSPVKCDNHGSIWFAGEAYHDLYGGYLQAAYLSGQEQATLLANDITINY
jgi:monoamine oxidase